VDFDWDGQWTVIAARAGERFGRFKAGEPHYLVQNKRDRPGIFERIQISGLFT
jgi:hypothetical protein